MDKLLEKHYSSTPTKEGTENLKSSSIKETAAIKNLPKRKIVLLVNSTKYLRKR